MWKTIHFGIQPRILASLLALSLIPLLVGTWVLVAHTRETLIQSRQVELANLSEIAAQQVVRHLQDATALQASVSISEPVRAALTEVRQKNAAFNAESARSIEKGWFSLAPTSPEIQAPLSHPLAAVLKEHNSIQNLFRQMAVIDPNGIILAATGPTDHYFFGDEPWFIQLPRTRDRAGSYISTLKYNKQAKCYSFEITTPIFSTSKQFLGILLAVFSVTDLATLLRPFQVGNSVDMMVLAEDGTIIASREHDLSNQIGFPLFKDVHPILQTQRIMARVERGTELLGFLGRSRTRLADTFPELKWNVLAYEPADNVLAQTKEYLNFALGMIGAGVLVVLLLALWFSYELTKPIVELDMHLEKL